MAQGCRQIGKASAIGSAKVQEDQAEERELRRRWPVPVLPALEVRRRFARYMPAPEQVLGQGPHVQSHGFRCLIAPE